MSEVTLKYGLTKQITIEVPEGTTVREVLSNPNNRAVLGYPENVTAINDGATMSPDDYVSDGDTIILEKQAAAKAA